jgi:hypothetical protein
MQLFINYWSTSLTVAATAEAVSLSVPPVEAAKLTGLGSGDHYLLTLFEVDATTGVELRREIVRCTAQAAGDLTVVRGQEGTVAQVWDSGLLIEARLTKATMETLRDSGGPELSDATPEPLGVAAPGTGGEAARYNHVHPLPTPAAIGAATAAQGALADSAVQDEDLSAVAYSGTYNDLDDLPFIPATPGDVGAATAAQGDKADTAIQPAALTAALADKVDKLAGYDLSQENFTPAEKAKLAGLDEAHYKGTFVNLAALEAALPTASAGNYADVDAGVGDPVLRYIWDASDGEWVAQAGSADPVTAAQVKTLYESNADTNAFTDAAEAKLAGVAAGATANADTDSLAEGATNQYHTEARVRGTVLTGLSLASTAVVAATDNVLQAIGKLAARLALAFDRGNHTGEQAISTVAGLQAALDAKAANPMTTAGDIIIGGASGAPQRLAVGSNGQVMKAVGGVPAWAAERSQCIPVACSDETTALTAGTGKVTFRMPYAFTLSAVRASLTTPQTSGSIFTLDINEAGASILSTKLTIDNAEKTSTTAATAAVISDVSLADDAEITIDIDQLGDGTAKGLKVYLIGVPT